MSGLRVLIFMVLVLIFVSGCGKRMPIAWSMRFLFLLRSHSNVKI